MVIRQQQRLKESLQSVDPSVFKQFIAKVWEELGWRTRLPQHAEIDIVVTSESSVPWKHPIQTDEYEKYIVKTKQLRAGSKVGAEDIRECSDLLAQNEEASAILVVTSNLFTKNAKKVANKQNVKTVNGDELAEIIRSIEKPAEEISDEKSEKTKEDTQDESAIQPEQKETLCIEKFLELFLKAKLEDDIKKTRDYRFVDDDTPMISIRITNSIEALRKKGYTEANAEVRIANPEQMESELKYIRGIDIYRGFMGVDLNAAKDAIDRRFSSTTFSD